MSEYFPKPKSLGANIKVELHLSNYATKADLQDETGVDTLDFAEKIDLANLKSNVNISGLKSKVDKWNNGKLETTSVDLNEVSNLVKNKVVKKTEYNKLVIRLMLFKLLMLVIQKNWLKHKNQWNWK